MNVITIILQMILAAIPIIGAIVAIRYMLIAWEYQDWVEHFGYPRFTYEQLKNFVTFDRIKISDYDEVMLFDNKITENSYKQPFDYVALYSYSDFLRLKQLVEYHEKNKEKLKTQQKKAKILQKMQRIINEQYEEIEKEVAEK